MGIYSYLQENPEENIDLTVDTAQGQVLVTDDNGNNGVLLTQSQIVTYFTNSIADWANNYDFPSGGMTETEFMSSFNTAITNWASTYDFPTGGMTESEFTTSFNTAIANWADTYDFPSGSAIKTNTVISMPPNALSGQVIEVTITTNSTVLTGILISKAKLYRANGDEIGEFSITVSRGITGNLTFTLPNGLTSGENFQVYAVLEDAVGNVFARVYASTTIIEASPPDVSNTTITGDVPANLYIGSTFTLTVNNKPTNSTIDVKFDGSNHGISVMQNPNNDDLVFDVGDHVEGENVEISIYAVESSLESLIETYNTTMGGNPSGSVTAFTSADYAINGLVDSIILRGRGGGGVASVAPVYGEPTYSLTINKPGDGGNLSGSASVTSISGNTINYSITATTHAGVQTRTGSVGAGSLVGVSWGFGQYTMVYGVENPAQIIVPGINPQPGQPTIVSGAVSHTFQGAAYGVATLPTTEEVVLSLTPKTDGTNHIVFVDLASNGGSLTMEW